ncbi:MAG TPA: hypothetical protein VMT28_17820 [Terriglobales bacterium]|nr:hypothetical protein [Terriglobales bacterium]
MNDSPKLLVEWSSPWQEFLTAIRPALGRSPERLAGEAPTGLWPYRGMLACWVLEATLLVAVIVLPTKLAFMHPYVAPPLPKYDILYFSGDELPRTQDVGGAQAGRSGRAGGREGRHRTQTIRVSRGNSLREQVVDAPNLKLPRSDAPVANLLAYRPIPGPPPAEGLRSSLRAPAIPQTVVPPAADVQRDKLQPAPALNASVIPPAPAPLRQNLASLHLPGNRAETVVPPPVSAPEQIANLNPKLTLPAPVVIAPPPQITHDIASSGPGFGPGELRRQVIPPPVQVGPAVAEHRALGGMGNGLGTATVVPPPVQVAGGGLSHQPVSGLGGGLGAVVPPPPTVTRDSSLGGRGTGNRGAGLGGPLDVGAVAAPPSHGGSVAGNGVVVSNRPGSQLGVPGGGGAGSLALSPAGGDKPGLGGSGGGNGIGRGNGPGSGLAGEGPGAGKEGTGRGSDTLARGGISPYPGPGGAGSGTGGKPPIPGVSVSGGSSNIVTLPSFSSGGSEPSVPGRSSAGTGRQGPDITIVASSRSGGAFNFYGALKGDNYTIYIDTTLGTAVLQFADPNSATRANGADLTPPAPIRADLPANLHRARLVISCVLDRSGVIRNPRLLEPAPKELASKVLAALANWKFRPAFRGDEPVEVNAILGFGIDTR